MAKKDKSGCGKAMLVLVAFAIIVEVLSAVWGLLAVLAVASFGAAFALYKKRTNQPGAEQDDDSFYTQKCPNCGAQIQVSEYERNAHCQYCGSTFAADRKPLKKPEPAEKTGFDKLLAEPIKALSILGAIFLVLSLVGYSFAGSGSSSSSSRNSSSSAAASSAAEDGSDSPTSSDSSDNSDSSPGDSASVAPSDSSSAATSGSAIAAATAPAAAARTAANLAPGNSATASPAASIDNAKLTANTEYLEYSDKETDPLSLVKCSLPEAEVATDGTIDLSTVGQQNVEYTVSLDGESRDVEIGFTVRDTKKPVINLADDNPRIDQGMDFDPASAIDSIYDPVDGALERIDAIPGSDENLTPGLDLFYEEGWYQVDGAIDPNTPGTYSYMITASDKHGNVATKELLVTVNEPVQAEPAVAKQAAPARTYVANINTGKFHIPGCRDISKMEESNKVEYTTTRQEMLDMGYTPCGHCHP